MHRDLEGERVAAGGASASAGIGGREAILTHQRMRMQYDAGEKGHQERLGLPESRQGRRPLPYLFCGGMFHTDRREMPRTNIDAGLRDAGILNVEGKSSPVWEAHADARAGAGFPQASSATTARGLPGLGRWPGAHAARLTWIPVQQWLPVSDGNQSVFRRGVFRRSVR